MVAEEDMYLVLRSPRLGVLMRCVRRSALRKKSPRLGPRAVKGKNIHQLQFSPSQQVSGIKKRGFASFAARP